MEVADVIEGDGAFFIHTLDPHPPRYVPPPPPDIPGCVDHHKLCEHWAESGECTDNPGELRP